MEKKASVIQTVPSSTVYPIVVHCWIFLWHFKFGEDVIATYDIYL